MDRPTVISNGNLAGIALQTFEKEVRGQQERNLALFMGEFRAGQFSESKALSFIAAHCALEDIVMSLKRKMETANKLSKEIIDGSPH